MALHEIGVDRWQYDAWYRIIDAALNGNPDQPQLADLPNFNQPAASRYAATTPALLGWFDHFNQGRPYTEQVRPFNFLTAFTSKRNQPVNCADASEQPMTRKRRASQVGDLPRPIAPYNADPGRAAANCFDRVTGASIPADRLKTYAEALSNYHLHPEDKFLNGDYLDRGPTVRRRIEVVAVRFIGKEANRWEEQFYLGYDPETQIEYDGGPEAVEQVRTRIRDATRTRGQRRLAEMSGVSREQIRSIISGGVVPRKGTVARLLAAINRLQTNK